MIRLFTCTNGGRERKGVSVNIKYQKRKEPYGHRSLLTVGSYSFSHIQTRCCQETIRTDRWPCVSLSLICPFHRSASQPPRDKQMLNTGRRAPARLIKGHIDPIANQYVPNMRCLLWLVMKKQASWFIVMMPWEAGEGTQTLLQRN